MDQNLAQSIRPDNYLSLSLGWELTGYFSFPRNTHTKTVETLKTTLFFLLLSFSISLSSSSPSCSLQNQKFKGMSESEEQGASGSYTGIQLQGGSSSSSSPGSGGGMMVGGGAWRVNKEVALPILMALKASLEAEIKQVKSLINMVHGEEVLVAEDGDDDQIAYQRETQKKELADEQDKSLELQMQIEIIKLTLECGFSAGTASY